MIIEIIDVGTPESVKTGKGQYQTLQVSFKNEQGQVQGKKLMSKKVITGSGKLLLKKVMHLLELKLLSQLVAVVKSLVVIMRQQKKELDDKCILFVNLLYQLRWNC